MKLSGQLEGPAPQYPFVRMLVVSGAFPKSV